MYSLIFPDLRTNRPCLCPGGSQGQTSVFIAHSNRKRWSRVDAFTDELEITCHGHSSCLSGSPQPIKSPRRVAAHVLGNGKVWGDSLKTGTQLPVWAIPNTSSQTFLGQSWAVQSWPVLFSLRSGCHCRDSQSSSARHSFCALDSWQSSVCVSHAPAQDDLGAWARCFSFVPREPSAAPLIL